MAMIDVRAPAGALGSKRTRADPCTAAPTTRLSLSRVIRASHGLLIGGFWEGPVDQGGFGDGRAHGPVLPAIELQVGVVIARLGRVSWPRLYDAVTADQHYELDELLLEIRSPGANGVLVWPLGHRLGKLPANPGDIGASVISRECHPAEATRKPDTRIVRPSSHARRR